MHLRCLRCCLVVAGLAVFVFAAEPSAIWLEVPFVKQKGNGCGAACIAMVMQYWAAHAGGTTSPVWDPQAIFKALYSNEAKGIFASEMEGYFRDHGFLTYAFRGQWADLQNHLSKGRPLIVSLNVNGEGKPLHYVVAAGLDPATRIILVNDPARQKLLKMNRSAFENSWKATKNWTLLAVPKNAE